MPTETQDAAVRDYLRALKDPESLRDDDAVSDLERRLERAEDPLERVKLHAALERARRVDPGAYEEGFVTHAKQWAREHGVSGESFKAEGVSDEVLARAGLAGGPRRRPSAGRAPAERARRRVSRDEVRTVVRQYRTFTRPEIQKETGASRETVRAVLEELLDAGEVRHAGPDESRTTRGRTASVYERT